MNEHQRQAYLTTLGIENYMPRWLLVNAPASKACELPQLLDNQGAVDVFSSRQAEPVISSFGDAIPVTVKPVIFADVLRDLTSEKKPQTAHVSAIRTDAVINPPVKKNAAAFTLSIWRPQAGLLIVDARNTLLALPTEALLRNLIRAFCSPSAVIEDEEILRWPMVTNAVVSSTIDDARSVLQVWLEVELERRPAKHLLFMGENAAAHFLPMEQEYNSVLFKKVELSGLSATAVITPSLVELLQQPLLKEKLWQALRSWR